jgi:hypothetical protein
MLPIVRQIDSGGLAYSLHRLVDDPVLHIQEARRLVSCHITGAAESGTGWAIRTTAWNEPSKWSAMAMAVFQMEQTGDC